MAGCSRSFNKICGRICIELTAVLESPLAVSSGEMRYSDADVSVNALGELFLPGSSLAGAVRAYDREAGLENGTCLFGKEKSASPGGEEDRQSRIFFYDAVFTEATIGKRDGVRLNERKTVQVDSKFERQIVQRGASLVLRMEIVEREAEVNRSGSISRLQEEEIARMQAWVWGMNAGQLRLGARKNRGFGRITVQKVHFRTFDLQGVAGYREWLAFSWASLRHCCEISGQQFAWGRQERSGSLEMELQIPGTLLVRNYEVTKTLMAAEYAGKRAGISDYGQLTEEDGKAVIPGSALAGALRGRIAQIAQEIGGFSGRTEAQRALEPFFGAWREEGDRTKSLASSKVIVEEALVDEGHRLTMVRNAVNRFTGGSAEGALYQEDVWAGGLLRISVHWKSKEIVEEDALCGLLLWGAKDLENGLLAVGGETAVGRGVLSPKGERAILMYRNGQVISEEGERQCMRAAAAWCRRQGKMVGTGEEQNG